MTDLSLDQAQAIVAGSLRHARAQGFKPLVVAVLDGRGSYKALAAEDGTSLKRAEIAMGKAYGALALGLPSRAITKMAAERPQFLAAVTHAVGGLLVPAPGGVLLRDRNGGLVGAVGISGDTSDNDEAAAVTAIQAAGLTPESGA